MKIIHMLATSSILAFSAGCPGGEEYVPGATGDTDCVNNSCDVDELLYPCLCEGAEGVGPSKCQDDPADQVGFCDSWCNNNIVSGPDSNEDAVKMPVMCSAYPDQGGCGGWDPDDYITLTGGVHYVDAFLITGILNDPAPVWTCQNEYVEFQGGGGFEINDADRYELLYELGLRDGDIPQELNNLPLDDANDVLEAFGQLWTVEGETDYTLEILRGSTPVNLYYSVYFS